MYANKTTVTLNCRLQLLLQLLGVMETGLNVEIIIRPYGQYYNG